MAGAHRESQMPERKYSIAEIDRMRRAVAFSCSCKEVEDRLRTYMLNGTDPEELERMKADIIEARIQQKRAARDLSAQRPAAHARRIPWPNKIALSSK
jgi:hypothetical protein